MNTNNLNNKNDSYDYEKVYKTFTYEVTPDYENLDTYEVSETFQDVSFTSTDIDNKQDTNFQNQERKPLQSSDEQIHSNYNRQHQQQSDFSDFSKFIKEKSVLAAIAFIPTFFWVGLLEKTPLGKKTATQGLWLLILLAVFSTISSIISEILSLLRLTIIVNILSSICGLVCIAFAILSLIGVIKTLIGENFEIPVVGKIKIFDK